MAESLIREMDDSRALTLMGVWAVCVLQPDSPHPPIREVTTSHKNHGHREWKGGYQRLGA